MRPALPALLILTTILLWACTETPIETDVEPMEAKPATARPAPPTPKALTYQGLLKATDAELAKIDIAEMNMACAEGLPGAENIDIPAHLKTLDRWARAIRKETEKYLYQFYRNPGEYNNSLAYYKVLLMVSVLQQDLGLMYNMELVNSGIMDDYKSSRFFRDSNDVFLHGFFSPKHSGTCSSIPVLVAAVGRRLGYPIKLVTNKLHLYNRWEGKEEIFNVDAASRGLHVKPDEYYRTWPSLTPENEIESEGHFRSKSPKEELALFLNIRGYVLMEHHRHKEALEVALKVSELRPKSVRAKQFSDHIMSKMNTAVADKSRHRTVPEHQWVKQFNRASQRRTLMHKPQQDIVEQINRANAQGRIDEANRIIGNGQWVRRFSKDNGRQDR